MAANDRDSYEISTSWNTGSPTSPLGVHPRRSYLDDETKKDGKTPKRNGSASTTNSSGENGQGLRSRLRTQSGSWILPRETRKPLLTVALAFATALGLLSCVYVSFPDLTVEERTHLRLPTNLAETRELGRVLARYADRFWLQVVSAYVLTYVFLQSFAIPGSIFLSVVAGFVYPFPLALFLVCLCSACGASLCYTLSLFVGRPLVQRFATLASGVARFRKAIEANSGHLLYYIIFLRITPFLPNWSINLASPLLDVPILPFFIGTFIGVAPPSCIAIQTGRTLNEIVLTDAVGGMSAWLNLNSALLLSGCALLSLIPMLTRLAPVRRAFGLPALQ